MKSSTQPLSIHSQEICNMSDAQVIYLNEKGFIVSSSNSIFSTILLQKKSIFEWSPFLESIYSSLFEEKPNEVTQFLRVTTIQDFLPGIYDYTFVKLPGEHFSKEVLMWIITDRTTCYQKMQKLQQIENESLRARF